MAERVELSRKKCKPAILFNCLHSEGLLIHTFVLNITFWALKHVFFGKKFLENYLIFTKSIDNLSCMPECMT